MQIGGYEIQVPFVTTSSDHIKAVLELADIKPGDRIVDLGSGDGRMVLEFAKAGGFVTGYEIKPELVTRSRHRIEEAGLTQCAHIYQSSFWEADLSPYQLIYLYGMGSIMGRLEKKLEAELKPGTKVISNIFHFPHWKVKKSKNSVNLYIIAKYLF